MPSGWKTALRTPTPSSSSSSSDEEDTNPKSNHKIWSLDRNAELAKSLDLDSRVDYAKPNVTPFTIAARQGEQRAKEAEQAAKAAAKKAGKGNEKKAGPGEAKYKRPAEPIDEPRVGKSIVPAVRTVKADKRKNAHDRDAVTPVWNGWVDGAGQPIANSAPRATKTIAELLDEVDKKKPAKPRKPRAKKDTAVTTKSKAASKTKNATATATKGKIKDKHADVTFSCLRTSGPSPWSSFSAIDF
jgi:hypothetical protein